MIEISASAEPITGTPRKLRMNAFRIEKDKNMTLAVDVVLQDVQGNDLIDTIKTDHTITESQRALLLQQYQNRQIVKSTRDSFINPANGAIALPDENGDVPEGFIPELEYFQQIKVSDIVSAGFPIGPDTCIADIVYFMLTGQLGAMVERQQV